MKRNRIVPALFVTFVVASVSVLVQSCALETTGTEPPKDKPTACNTDADCDDSNVCTIDKCGATNLCEFTNVPDGSPEAVQVAGDCKRTDCNAGVPSTVNDDMDVPNDTEPCTQDVCMNGAPSNPALPDTSPCQRGNQTGTCVMGECQVACGDGLPPCNDNNPCTDDYCSAQTSTCVYTVVDGVPTPGATQTPGDCKQQFCVNGIDSPVPDDFDLPDDGNNCTEDVCTLGVASNPATMAGIYCEAGKPEVCDGNKACVECVVPENCVGIIETDCKKRDCVANKCVPKFLGNETTATTQQPGDCQRNVCNGTDGGYMPIADDTDLPNDNNDCTADSCQGGVPKATNEATTKKCGMNNTFVCDGMGACVGCNMPTDCAGTDDFCKTRTCVNKVCGYSYTANNTPLPMANQINQDCKVVVCDGMGNTVTRNQDTDTKPDGNACTKDQCSSGMPVYPNEAIGFSCSVGANDICDGNGACKKSYGSGKTCTANNECAYGNCKDGYCCNNACGNTCQDCDVAGSLGTCVNVPKGQTDGTCTGVTVCDGNQNCKKVDGQTCSQNSDCLNNFCVDGVCCGTACTGQCKSCNVAGSVGQCVNTPSMQADANGSPACSGGSVCDGTGGCKKSNGQGCNGGSECLSTNCVDNTCCSTNSCTDCKSCNVASSPGTCTNVPAATDDGGCGGNNTCDGNGACKKKIGQSCPGGNGDCYNAQCVDGYCCNATCTGTCQSCDVSGSLGTCTNVPLNSDDATGTMMCSGNTVSCDGSGNCKKENGQMCTGNGDCLSNKCVDGVCCNTTCTGECLACNVSGSAGTCTNVPSGQQDPTTCSMAGQQCDGSGVCKVGNGGSCSAPADCISNFCADGVCCGSACSGTCQSCNLTGTVGMCMTVPKYGKDDSCMGTDACTGGTGGGACKKDDGTSCGNNPECVSGKCQDPGGGKVCVP